VFNAKIRNFLTHGKFVICKINNKGIPITYNPHVEKSFISPFYVVHYGIIYSEKINNVKVFKKEFPYLWFEDSSLRFWNTTPQEYKDEYFKNCADYIVENIKLFNGNYHILYEYNWPYKNMAYKVIKTPWWSGLTDGYAILLLLRAYVVYKNNSYLKTAKKLYLSVLTPIEKGGSLTYFNGYPWIEEYVNWRFPKENPRVLNGMIYAYYGVKAYEIFNNINQGWADKLLISIFHNITYYDLNYWSYYDAVKTVANVKYHNINYSLLKDIYQKEYCNIQFNKFSCNKIEELIKRWEVGVHFPILWLFYAGWSISKLHVIIEIFVIQLLLMFFLKRIKFNYGKK
jgi:hypothetical protein